MKAFFDFLSKMSEAQPLTVLLVIIVGMVLVGFLVVLVAKTYLDREVSRDKKVDKDDIAEIQKDSAYITLANTLALQGGRALNQGDTLNELLRRQTVTMEGQQNGYDAQSRAMTDISLHLKDLAYAQAGSVERLVEIKKISEAINGEVVETKKTLITVNDETVSFRDQIRKDIKAIQDALAEIVTKLADKNSTIPITHEQMESIAKMVKGVNEPPDQTDMSLTLSNTPS